MFIWNSSLFQIVFRTSVIYVFLLVGMRLAGKREVGQMTIFDLVTILIISNAVQNAMVGPDTSLDGGVVAALTILILNFGVSSLGIRSPRWQALVAGTPTLLIHDGQPIPEHLRKERLSQGDLEMALREHGITDMASVRNAVLEIDGSISVVQMDSQQNHTHKRFRYLKSTH